MNKTAAEAVALTEEIKNSVFSGRTQDCEVVLCVPFTSLQAVVKAVEGTSIKVGAQNVHFEPCGAFTGEISVDMLKEIGVEYVIVGHSERRQYFGETDQTVNKRAKAALAGGLVPIVCIGELLSQRESGETENVLSSQLKLCLEGMSESDIKKVVIAYEPVWAIGTGKTATDEQAGDACLFIRECIAKLYNHEIADGITIQYGGSMNAANAAGLLSKEDVDGGLIGGASLKAIDFSKIVKSANTLERRFL